MSSVTDRREGKHTGRVNHMEIVQFDETLWHLWLDVQVLADLIDYLPENKPRREKIIHTLCRMMDLYGDDPARSGECRELLKPLWTDANASDLNVTGIGHAHIDTGWLWLSGKRFENAPGLSPARYIFWSNTRIRLRRFQPQHYQFVKDNYPGLYEKIKTLVASGRWEIQGGMWVEADCNIISGNQWSVSFFWGKTSLRMNSESMSQFMASRCVRLFLRPASDSQEIRCRFFHDPENFLESVQ